VRSLASATIAKVRQQAQVGVIADALADELFCRAVVEAIGAGRELSMAQGKLRFTRTRAFADLAGGDIAALSVERQQAQSSNTVVTLGDRLFLKAYRRIRPGMNPEFEVGRFLTEQAQFANCAPVAGAIEYIAADGTSMTLGLLQGHVPNQGDGWSFTLAYLERFYDQQRTAVDPPPADAHGAYLALIRILGQRTGELHRAFAGASGDPEFAPEAVAVGDLAQWKVRARDEVAATLDLLERNLQQLAVPVREAAQTLLSARQDLAARIESCAPGQAAALKIRHHGDYHLGQVLLSQNDFIITDFEGEPGRPFSDRKRKHSPLRDVASMLRSFDYARWTSLWSATEPAEERARFGELAATWHGSARETFLAAYDEATRDSGLYSSLDDARELLELFEIEKACYELRYEINNRPGWIHVPLQGLLAVTSRAVRDQR
jgi:maltose alpha-D-glucosyltransferase/alpha-amylase